MNALQALEWARFLELALPEARTQPGRALLDALNDPGAWAPDLASARLLQQKTQEITPLLDRDALWGPLLELASPEDSLTRLARGAVLEIEDFVLLRGWLYAIDSWAQTPREEIKGEHLKKAIAALADPMEPLRVLDKILTPEGELSERATPKLASIHAEIRSLKKEIAIVLDQLIKTFAQKGVLQENFSDVRDGRYVIPVKISSQGEVDGIIYEASASRQTVFVEPREVSQLNNRLRKAQNDLIQEIYAILEETSRRLQPFGAEISASVEILSYWDATQARARFGRHYSGKPIDVSEDRVFVLHQSAHPLLWWSLDQAQIIRNEIEFGEPARTLLITGPNTGGKTVLLKTLGLAGLCARTGFPFPGTDHLVVPFFDRFFADLGDSQSIEKHLSSFAGHVLLLKEILENVSGNSLVLMDELNSATDPEEGAALGRAFLETVMERGALIVATTHDPHLKALGASDSRIMSASMEFDETSRSPTYLMALGVPGRSRALETAERLGVPEPVLSAARKYLSKEHQQFEQLLARLEADSQEAARARKEALAIREDAERLRKEWTQSTGSSVNEMLDRTRQKLRRVLEQAQDEVRASVRKLDELRNRKDLDHARAQISEAYSVASSRLESALQEEAPEIAEALKKSDEKTSPKQPGQPDQSGQSALQPGTWVRIPKWKTTGKILEILKDPKGGAKSGKAKVAMGTLQMTLSLEDIDPLTEAETAMIQASQPRAPQQRSFGISETHAPPSQLDLRGMRLDDAMSELERYLDQAFRSGAMLEVTIIHGLGTGALREGARKLIANLPYVKVFKDSGLGAGGAGATVVEFDRD